jgi:hypothetical protein
MAEEWSDYVSGEWWVDKDGTSMFADQDIGDAGHEAVAVMYLLPSGDEIAAAIREWAAENPEAEEELWYPLADLPDCEECEAQLFFNGYIPDEVGEQLVGEEVWRDMNADVRLAFAKHEGAILVIGTDFAAYEVSARSIDAMQSFLYEQTLEQAALNEEELATLEGDMTVEEYKTKRSARIPVDEFLTIKYPRDLWVWE